MTFREKQSRDMAHDMFVPLVTMCLLSAHADQPDKAVTVGKDVTLECDIGDASLTDNSGVYWTRDGLEWPDYIMFYRGRVDTYNPDARYLNRTKFADPKDNNFSLIVQNVSKNDSGTYECWLMQGFDKRTINVVKLSVTEPELDQDPDEKKLWMTVKLAVIGVVFLAAMVALGVFVFINRRQGSSEMALAEL